MTTYHPRGVCSQRIDFTITDQGKLTDVSFLGGCNGNLKAIAKLIEGKDAQEVIDLLEGNTCGPRSTSCADQLAQGLKEALSR